MTPWSHKSSWFREKGGQVAASNPSPLIDIDTFRGCEGRWDGRDLAEYWFPTRKALSPSRRMITIILFEFSHETLGTFYRLLCRRSKASRKKTFCVLWDKLLSDGILKFKKTSDKEGTRPVGRGIYRRGGELRPPPPLHLCHLVTTPETNGRGGRERGRGAILRFAGSLHFVSGRWFP